MVHEVEALVDLFEGQDMGHELIDLDLAAEVVLNKRGHRISALPAWPEGINDCNIMQSHTNLQMQIPSIRGQSPVGTGGSKFLWIVVQVFMKINGVETLAGSSNANDDGRTPAFVASFKSSTLGNMSNISFVHRHPYHGVNEADALEGEIEAAVSHVDEHLLDWLGVVLGVDKVGRAKLLC